MSPPFRTASDFAALAWRAKYFLLVALVVGAGVGYKKAGSNSDSYTASTNLFVTLRAADDANALQQSNNFSISRIASYVSVVTSDEVLEPVADKFDMDVDELRAEVSASAAEDTVVLYVSVVDPSSKRAGELANAVGAQLKRVLPAIDAPGDEDKSPIKVVTLRAATDGAGRGGTTPKKGALIGAAGGLLLAYALAVLRALADRRVRTPARLREATGQQVLGQIPAVRKLGEPWLSGDDRSGPIADAARRVALQVWPRGGPNGTQVVLVTSPRAGTGKTLLAAHLAAAAAEMGLRTVLVDANLRSPAVATRLGVEGSAGLQAVLRDLVPVADVTAGHGPASITVLPAGPADPDPSSLLASATMRSALGSLREAFDVVVIDGAPLNPTADALTLVSSVDGVVVVVEPRSPLGETALAVRELSALSAPVVGLVLNRSTGNGDGAGFSDPVAPDLRATDRTKLTYDSAS